MYTVHRVYVLVSLLISKYTRYVFRKSCLLLRTCTYMYEYVRTYVRYICIQVQRVRDEDVFEIHITLFYTRILEYKLHVRTPNESCKSNQRDHDLSYWLWPLASKWQFFTQYVYLSGIRDDNVVGATITICEMAQYLAYLATNDVRRIQTASTMKPIAQKTRISTTYAWASIQHQY